MVVPFRSFAVFGLAFGMLAAGYLIGPSRGATTVSPPPEPKAVAEVPEAKPVSPLVALRPPVPVVGPQHVNYYAAAPADQNAAPQNSATSSDKPVVDPSTSSSKPSDPAQAQPQTQTAALTTDQPQATGGNPDAKHAIEFDGYKDVHDMVKDPDGGWHARAMRGRTEIAVRVDASGNVSTE
jgi:hypothetical protein